MKDHQTKQLPHLLSQKELCEYIGKSQAWAERARLEGSGPPFLRLGRSIRYRASDVQDWIDAALRKSTSSPLPMRMSSDDVS